MPSVITVDTHAGCCTRLIHHLLMLLIRPRASGQRHPARCHIEHPLAFENPDTYGRWYRS